MAYLENVTTDELHEVLAEVEGKRPAQRVMAGISYKDGVDQTTIARRYGVHRNTVRNWLRRLERLEEEPYEDVVYDAPRPGRPTALDDEQREHLQETLSNPPDEAGIDEPEWTPTLVQQYIDETFGVSYHVRHVRRLLDELDTFRGTTSTAELTDGE